MARRGPKSIPTALYAIDGAGKSKARVSREVAVLDPRLPPMPEWLHPYAQAEWAFIVPHLHAMQILKIIDKAVVAAYCSSYGRWRLAEEGVQKITAANPTDPAAGLLMKTQAGNVVQNPLVGVANAARRDLVRAAAELGLTPAARAQIASEGGDDDEDAAKFGF